MRFSIQEQNEKKMFFHVPAAAHKATGLHLTTIKTILERGGNPIYHRKFDNKLFEIRKEDPIKLITIEGEDFFSLEEIQAKFNLSPTKFLNQVKNDKFAKKIDWISPELFPGNAPDTEEIDELEVLREEMKSQFEKFQAEIDRLSAKVEKLETEKASLPVATAEVSPQEENQQSPIFQSKTALERTTFTEKNIAWFIKDGIVGEIKFLKPKADKYILVNEKREYLPDLVKEIIETHIHPEMGQGDQEKTKEFSERLSYGEEAFSLKGAAWNKYTAQSRMMGRIRRLDSETLDDIVKELMKMI